VTVGDDVIFLGLRLGIVLVLYLFLFMLVILTQRELHREGVRRQVASDRHSRLVVVDPGTTNESPGHVIPLEPVTRVGRASDQTVILDDEFVSAAHAIVVLRNGRWWVRDEGSTNGTLVNGVPIESETALDDGDEVQIGHVVLRLAE
jgi:pSer/pThr/pTyr-binding forkhead associated (FHA) protein